MVKRNFSVQRGGYNVTPQLVNYEMAKPNNEKSNQSAPGLPYRLRQRMSGEEIIGMEMLCMAFNGLLKIPLVRDIVWILALTAWVTVCYYMGVQYGR